VPLPSLEEVLVDVDERFVCVVVWTVPLDVWFAWAPRLPNPKTAAQARTKSVRVVAATRRRMTLARRARARSRRRSSAERGRWAGMGASLGARPYGPLWST
jgi:hypothetical protein